MSEREEGMKHEKSEGCQHEPVGMRYPEGTEPGLSKDYGQKNDSDLTNGFVPQVRKG